MNPQLVLQLPAGSSLLLGLAALAAAAILVTPTRAQSEQLDVGVRPSVPDKAHLWSHDKAKVSDEGGHSKLYGILKVEEIKSDQRLVKPVDEGYIARVLIMQLEANGFHQIVAGQKPEIILTVSYGRGELANPYIRDQGEVGGSGLPVFPMGNDEGVPVQTITGAFPLQLYDQKTPGWEAKLQKASFEKLFLRVTAWSYPAKGQKPLMLWKTVMVVDDPDHRDLNIVAAKMLEAGAPYFDRLTKDKEVEVQKPLPTGRVIFGTPEVVEPRK